MARAGFYNENEFRRYPLVHDDGEAPFPDSVLVDFGCLIGPAGRFVSGTHSVWLVRATAGDGTVEFEFRSDAPGLAGLGLTFTVPIGAEFTTAYADTSPRISSSSSGADEPLFWEGYLVVGDLAEFLTGQDLRWVGGEVVVEPALVQNLAEGFVNSINLANGPRTVADAPAAYSSASGPAEGYVVSASGLDGDVRFVEGYNASISLSATANQITLAARLKAGAGEACEEVPRYTGEPPADADGLLTGGPKCNDVVKGINGIDGRVVRFIPGNGILIERGAEAELVISVDWHALIQPVTEG